MKDLGLLRYFLGIEVPYSPRDYLLYQSKYIPDLFERACLTDNRIVDTPLATNARYSPSDGLSLPDPTLYLTIVGSLVYLTVIRPDIAHAVNVVSQFSLHRLSSLGCCSSHSQVSSGHSVSESFVFFYFILTATCTL